MTPKPIRLITSQGRIGDRSPNAIPGAAVTAAALAQQLNISPVVVGKPAPQCDDDWSVSLPQAHDTLKALQTALASALQAGSLPLLVANTCSASLATLPLAFKTFPNLKILWVDAHGDFNTPETTASGYLGGMVLAGACGVWDSGHGADVDPRHILIAGIRDIDARERALLDEAGVSLLSPAHCSAEAVMSLIGDSPVWIHIDWDALEPDHVPAAYSIRDGLLPQQLRSILAAIPAHQIAGIELAEFEAPDDVGEREKALATLLDIVAPLLLRQALT